ncbi:hypothetical protein BP6252_02085 [Coleophoma cylindrospora]|uniref:Kynurenine formamidase n=1 Tax=Coleophoma cylindrospora TaxID=1849047 RepID=A0A3D8SDT0_9HELO|nr:hypothetical protein BP6252_02085 [Coleophoma cylindrospora]
MSAPVPIAASRCGSWMPSSHKYGTDNERQRLTVWTKLFDNTEDASQDKKDSPKVWVIYIHGGAWRDPSISDGSLNPTIEQLVTASSAYKELVDCHVNAFASIDYRLSAHPNHPQDPSSTPADESRNAKHPDHIQDVQLALSFLQENYGFGARYILVGHSCGATLAFQTLMPKTMPAPKAPYIGPMAIAGVAGIYDLKLLKTTNTHPAYVEFLTGAFGPESEVWDRVSPAAYGKFGGAWPTGLLAVLASSKDDSLIDDPQIDSMSDAVLGVDTRVVRMKKELSGEHDDIWAEGVQLAKVIAVSLERFMEEKNLL